MSFSYPSDQRSTSNFKSKMAMLLRKLWESISINANSISHSHNRFVFAESSSLGDFDRIPVDVVMQIIKLVGPKDTAKLTLLCKSWRSLVSDNRLWIYFLQNYHDSWDSIFFSETNLRCGYPIQTFASHITTELSFMHIYAERERIPGSVIIDGGSGYCKFGWSKYSCPSGRSATFLEFGNIESPMYSRLRNFYATIYGRMHVRAPKQPIVVSLPICHYDGQAQLH